MKALVVDDDEKIRKVLTVYLQTAGYKVETAKDGIEALNQVKAFRPDVVLLDIMLPSMDGWQVCREVRKTSDIPILMLSACDEETDRVKGLDIGADDYVVKPFSPIEVLARIKAVMRRTMIISDNTHARVLQMGEILMDREGRLVKVSGTMVELTPTEYGILETMMSYPNQVFTRLQLIEKVQGYSFEGYERTYDSHIKNLRKKIESDPANPRYIKTVYGIGYKMVEDDE